MAEQKPTLVQATSFKKLFKIYMKTSRRRVIITIFTGALVFLALTSFFMVWYSYRFNSFFNYMDQNHDWLDDNDISVNGNEYLYDQLNIESNYLTKGIQEVTTKLDEIMPNVIGKTTGELRINVYDNRTSYSYIDNFLHTLDSNATAIIEANLLEGRMPQNYTELIFYKTNSSETIEVNDIVPLSGESYSEEDVREFVNFTIVGIIENLDTFLYNEGFSSDVVKARFYEDHWETEISKQFITTNDFFYEFVNTADEFTGSFQANIDFNYNFKVDHIKNMKTYLKNFQDFLKEYPTFKYIPGFYVSFCNDLLQAFNDFERQWQVQTISVFAASMPLVFLFGVICIETFNIGTHEQESKYRLIKTHGLKNKILARLVFTENIVTIGSCFVSGSVLGLFAGYFIFLGLNVPKEVSYFSALLQPVIIISLISLFVTFSLFKYFYDLAQTRKASILTSDQYKQKRKKFGQRLFSIPEITTLIPGIILTLVGLFLISFTNFASYFSPTITQYTLIFWFMTSIGILLLLVSVFLTLTRLITLFWRKVGIVSWKSRKSYLSLALKHLSIYGKNYQRTIMAIFILGLAIIPGLVMNKSLDVHSSLEANISVGCADIAVDGWIVGNELWKNNISNIEGVESVTEVSTIVLRYYNFDQWDYESYRTRFHVIQNVTQYLNIVNLTLIEGDGYTQEDITQLDTNYTYLMNRKYARDNNYHKDEVFTTKYITSEIVEPLELIYVNDFDYYPILTRTDLPDEYDFFMDNTIKIDLVMNRMTAEIILNASNQSLETSGNLLIKTTEGANKTKITEEISANFGLKAYTKETQKQEILGQINGFANTLFIISSIITAFAILLFGGINAINVYRQRLRIIESETQIGAKRRLIWGNFTIEVIFVILIPLVISMGIAVPIINGFSSTILNITESYVKFSAWQPWWLLILVAIGGMVILLLGWFARMIPLVKGYRPIKQE